jgi:uncharacterized protein YyaL (SSP411 family)
MTKLDTATSPYLLLHKDNPVAWRGWSPDTLAEAAAADKPILLSLGYAACHWCHVMNMESFSDADTAAYINDHFIPVLVDREDRPDIDQLYQAAANLMGFNGGWPLNIFLTPEGVPYFVAGYLPKEERLGQPAFRRILEECHDLYTPEKRGTTLETAANIRAQLDNLFGRDMRASTENINIDVAALRIGQRFDIFFGGLQGQMKFPSTSVMDVIWRAFLRTGLPQYSQLMFTTLDHILFGGLYDHVGGGFFRYTADERWLIPHFEKMLYDNALMVDLATGVWQYNRNELCRQRVAETIAWMLREMRVGDVFAAGLDADSEGEEGKFYLWSEAEVDAALMGTFSARFKQVYGVTRDGNHLGRNILRRLGNPQPTQEADEALLTRQREMLLAARGKRVRPARDDKVLTDWNGLAIAALANAGAVFERGDWIAAAVAAFDQILRDMGEGDRLAHAAFDGRTTAPGFADDYANMARAALVLWEVTGEVRFLEKARAWTAVMDAMFWDGEKGGYCYTPADGERLIVRTRMVADQPSPAANGTMLTVLSRLASLTGEESYYRRAAELTGAFGDEVNRIFAACGTFLTGVEYFGTGLEIIIVGHKGNARTQELVRTVWSKALPNRLLRQLEPGEALPPGHPATGQGMQNGQPTAYLCQRGQCSTPITSAVTLAQVLTLPMQQQQQRTA